LVSGIPRYYRQGVFAYEGRQFDIYHPTPSQRLQSYYSKVTDNGIFYGLFRTQVLHKLNFCGDLGGDWHFIAESLISGGCKMSTSTYIHRELGGASDSYKKLINIYGLPRIAAFFPSIFVALSAFRHMSRSSSFLCLPYPKILQCWLFTIILVRPITNFPYRLIKKLNMI
jgi:hypothetical protein